MNQPHNKNNQSKASLLLGEKLKNPQRDTKINFGGFAHQRVELRAQQSSPLLK